MNVSSSTASVSPPDKNALKLLAAERALQFIVPGAVLGVGSGSTVNAFISLLRPGHAVAGAVAASEASAQALRAVGVKVLDLNEVSELPVYVDGADEIDGDYRMIKGGGAALTREKIIAHVAREFVCIVDESKVVARLGAFALPLEVLPMAREFVLRRLRALGGEPVVRAGVVSDNGNLIVDVRGLHFGDALALEGELNQWPGVVCNGVFARRRADVLITAGVRGVNVSRL